MRSLSVKILIEEAKKLGLELDVIDNFRDVFYLKSNNKKVLFNWKDFWNISSVGYFLTKNKKLWYKVLSYNSYPVPKSYYFKKWIDLDIGNKDIKYPLVIKPSDTDNGKWILMNINSKKDLEDGIMLSFSNGFNDIIAQDQIFWEEYRILVLSWEVILWYLKWRPSVVWDGKSNIFELIEKENNNPLRSRWHQYPMEKIEIDSTVVNHLKKDWYNLIDIPPSWVKVELRWEANLGMWWTMEDLTSTISEEIKNMCIEISDLFWIWFCWIDLISKDITKPLKKSWTYIIELNAPPWIWWDRELTNVNTWRVILEKLFFQDKNK